MFEVEMLKIMSFLDIIGEFIGKIFFLLGFNLDYVLFEYCFFIKIFFLKVVFVKILGVGYWLYVEKFVEFIVILDVWLKCGE